MPSWTKSIGSELPIAILARRFVSSDLEIPVSDWDAAIRKIPSDLPRAKTSSIQAAAFCPLAKQAENSSITTTMGLMVSPSKSNCLISETFRAAKSFSLDANSD
jgi:hypothetical protein